MSIKRPTSDNLSQSNLFSIPPPARTKYLRRSLDMTLTKNPEKTLRKMNLKRIHIRKLADKPSYYPEELGKRYRICLKKKLFKTLAHAQIYSFNYLYGLEDLKNCKNLLKYTWSASEDCSDSYLINYFKRIPSRNLEKVSFCQGLYDLFDYNSIKKLYKQIGSLPRLKSFQTIRDPNPNKTNEDHQTLHRYLARLPNVQNFDCFLAQSDDREILRDLLDKGKSYEKVTRLRMGDPLFYRFQELFCNLRQLDIVAQRHLGHKISPDHGPSITQSFEELPHLEALSLQIDSFLQGTNFLFEGLLKLPQLTSFSLQTNCLRPNGWNNLTQFMKNQRNLSHLSLEIPYCDETQDSLLENLLQSLSQKPKLQYLSLNYVSERLFPVISNGMKRIVGTDQIKSFRCHLDAKRFCLPLDQSSLEGYCEFLTRNQKTLSHLLMTIPLLHGLNDHFAKVISQLKQIKTLELMILVNETSLDFVKEPLSLTFMLKNLGGLDSLTIDFPTSPQHKGQVIQLFKILHYLKSLRTLQLQLHELSFDVFSEDEVKIICTILNQQKSLFFALSNPGPFDNIDNMRKISFALWSLYERHSVAVNLSF